MPRSACVALSAPESGKVVRHRRPPGGRTAADRVARLRRTPNGSTTCKRAPAPWHPPLEARAQLEAWRRALSLGTDLPWRRRRASVQHLGDHRRDREVSRRPAKS
jgi:hypothetical protein